MVKPISPDEIPKAKKKYFPDEVIDTWNEIIATNFSSGSATVQQDDIVRALSSRLDITRNEVFNKGYLEVEDIYRAEGWKVHYDKPGYNESYGAFFEFKRK